MTHTFETTEISLKHLIVHPQNVRAKSETSYADEAVSKLAANIDACGLLQPLLVQKLEGNVYGVLAGGRRLAALNLLVENKDIKAFKLSTKVACRIVPVDVETTSTLSFAENEMQLPMDAIDRFEAFAAMQSNDGAGVADIARAFGITERVVKEAMRLGNIHPDIRQAHRAGKLNLDALRAFDAHPDPEVQLETYTSLIEANGHVNTWSVRNAFQNNWVRIGNALGTFVLDKYRAAGGEIVADLIEEDSILSDGPLVEKLLGEQLSDLAEEKRAELGFAWAEHVVQPDWDYFSDYGRVYPETVELDAESQAKVDALTAKIDVLINEYDAAETDEEQTSIESRQEELEAQLVSLTECYTESDLALAGVIAVWNQGAVDYNLGMILPEHMPERAQSRAGGATEADEVSKGPKLNNKLREDMAHVRTRGIGLALAAHPDVARDYAEFTLIRDIVDGFNYKTSTGTTITGKIASRGPEGPTGALFAIEDSFANVFGSLDFEWLALETDAEAFTAFRVLPEAMRGQILAYAVAQTLEPSAANTVRSDVRLIVEDEVLADIRDVWTPDEAFLKRLTNPDLLHIVEHDLHMVDEVKALQGSKKSGVVEYLSSLFAQPFATLSDQQREAVAAWAPEIMQRRVDEEDSEGNAVDAEDQTLEVVAVDKAA